MPAPPELLEARRAVRMGEVLRQLKSKHPPHADRHVGIAGKIEEYLDRKGGEAQPGCTR